MKELKTIQIDFKKGETILRPEDTPQGVYLIKSGYVRSYCVSESGKEITLNIFKPETYFPLHWAITNFDNEYFFEAMTNVKTFRLSKTTFEKQISMNENFYKDISFKLISQLEVLYKRMEHALGDNAYKKVTSTLVFLAKRHGKQCKDGIHISIPITHFCIATIAGLTRETTSIIMKQLSMENLISYKNKKIIILQEQLLQ